MEIERKFLVTAPPEGYEARPFRMIEQAYLCTEPVVRVRREDDSFYLTYKSRGLMAREEYNLPLDEKAYQHLLKKADGQVLTKKRYLLPVEGRPDLTFELDVFEGAYQGLILAEVEFASEEDAVAFAGSIGYPVIVRPAYTLGGTGGGIAYDEVSLREICDRGLNLSRVHEVLIERCIAGWKEIEFEVKRDSAGNVITICSMENIDPVGVHTGDSIVVAPTQTLANREYQMLRSAALDIISAL